jgi:membrane-associated phospholipid phosphatase
MAARPSIRRPALLLLAAAGLVAAVGPAWASATDDPYPYDLETGREIALFGAGGAALGGGLAIQHRQTPLTDAELAALDPDGLPGIDRFVTGRWSPAAAHVSDYMQVAFLFAPVLLLTGDEAGREPWTFTAMYGQTYLLTTGLTALIKGAAGRTRPYAYSDDPRVTLEEKRRLTTRRSFPSGHTSNAFAMAVFLGMTYETLYPGTGYSGLVWTSGLVGATTVGCLRVLAGRHFVTDVVAGAVLGAAVGWLVPVLHEVDPPAGDGSGGGKGFVLQYGFGF